ncbi:MAG: hypothetical protein KME27_23745 [Lyngbya sp. HA4199-MV5]|nr:hypothetical protein [Lyngbya sp. HA4199-MV5]
MPVQEKIEVVLVFQAQPLLNTIRVVSEVAGLKRSTDDAVPDAIDH